MLRIMTSHEAHIQSYKDWIAQLMAEHNVTASELARRAGLAESTLTRLMSDTGSGNLPREGTIAKIERAFNTRRPVIQTTNIPAGARGVIQDPRVSTKEIAGILSAAAANDLSALEAYMVADRALDLKGYMPGDVLLIDTEKRPENGDIVAVSFGSPTQSTGRVSLRIYDTLFLISHSTDDSLRRPILNEPGRVQLVGVVQMAVRRPAQANVH